MRAVGKGLPAIPQQRAMQSEQWRFGSRTCRDLQIRTYAKVYKAVTWSSFFSGLDIDNARPTTRPSSIGSLSHIIASATHYFEPQRPNSLKMAPSATLVVEPEVKPLVKSVTMTAKLDDWHEDLLRDGYAVVKGAVSKEHAEGYVEEMYSWLESL